MANPQPTRMQRAIGETLRTTRESHRPPVSKDDLARALGITAAEYDSYEQGNVPIPFDLTRVEALAPAYGWDEEAQQQFVTALGRGVLEAVLGQKYANLVLPPEPSDQ